MSKEKVAEQAVKNKDVTLIPKCQRNEGWVRGAQLLEHWMANPSFVFSNQNLNQPAEESIITMEWVLSEGDVHEDARAAHSKILNNASANFETANSNKLLVERLEADTGLNLRSMKIGDTKSFHHFQKQSAAAQHQFHIQTIGVSGNWSANAMTAALANFNFHLLARGNVEVVGTNDIKVTIEGVGVYVRDGFDFTGDQDLGCWDFLNMKYFGGTNFWGKSHVLCVDNKTFRDWRQQTGMGGEFSVFSNIERRNVRRPHTFTLPSKITFQARPEKK